MDTMMERMTPFIIVRHPFVRLVSAYEDKMLNPHPFPYNYHHKIQETIKRRRRNKKKTINFPKDLLNSQKYQQMLRRKVFKSFSLHQYQIIIEGHNPKRSSEAAVVLGVRRLAYSGEEGEGGLKEVLEVRQDLGSLPHCLPRLSEHLHCSQAGFREVKKLNVTCPSKARQI